MKFPLFLALLALAVLHPGLVAAEGSPNLGLSLQPGQRANPRALTAPPAGDDEDEDEKTDVPHVDMPRALSGYDDAVSAFERSIAELRSDIKNEDNLPFLMTHGVKTARVVLMIHGLTDSPYYMKSLAKTFFDRGYNVVGILVPGHGTRPEDLLHVRVWQWRREVDFGMDVAAELGDEISLAGFSTGGALVIDELNRNVIEREESRRVGALYLFSPAIKIANPDAYQACIPGATFLHPWAPDLSTGQYPDPATVVEDNPYRYKKMATNSVCQLYKLTFANSLGRPFTMMLLGRSKIGVFAVESQADTTVSPDAVSSFMKDAARAGAPTDFISYPKDAHIGHADVTRPESNPAYRALDARLNAFLTKHEAAVPAAIKHAQFGLPSGGSLDRLRSTASGAPLQ